VRVAELLEERSLTVEQAVELLNQHDVKTAQGKPVTPRVVKHRLTRDSDVPVEWAAAFELDPETLRKERVNERPPQAPDDAKLETKIEVLPQSHGPARIAGIYKFAGGMLAEGAGSPGVAKVWGDAADPIAKLWVEAARDNPWAARFVNLVNSGGATGDLVGAHAYMLGATLYVLGARIPAGGAIFAKYSGYRPVATDQPPPQQEPPTDINGGPPGAAHAAADATVE
jgi:hypothetical protein